MVENVAAKYTSKEKAIKAHPNLSYEFDDVRKAATVGFGLTVIQILIALSDSMFSGWVLIGVLMNLSLFAGLSFLILKKVEVAVIYYLGFIGLSLFGSILQDITQDDFGFVGLFFQSIPLMIVVGLIQPAYSSIIEINKYVENPIEDVFYFRVIKNMVYGICWILFIVLAIGIIGLLSNL